MRQLKWISLLLALCLLLATLPVAFAEDIELAIDDEAIVETDVGEAESEIILIDETEEEEVSEVDDLQVVELEPAEATNAEPVSNAAEGIAITEANFPDASFRSYLLSKECDEDGDGYLSADELEWNVSWLNISNKMIQNLKGIELLSDLEYLNCPGNLLTSLDVSKNTNLKYLYCDNNQLTSLDVSKNAKLESLSCSNNQLTSLDVSKNAALKTLYCSDNQLTALNVSGLAKLENLTCTNNALTSLKVDNCAALKNLNCYKNQLTALSLTGDSALAQLSCYNNNLTTLDLSNFNSGVQALFTDENTQMNYDTMRIGNTSYYVYCDNYVELTMNGKVLRPLNAKSIAFDTKEATLIPGETLQLKPTISPANAKPVLTYSTTDKYITLSDTGLVTAVKEGYAYITVTTDNKKNAYFYVYVKAPTVSLDPSSVDLGIGDTYQLTPTIDPAHAKPVLTYTSSTENVTVSSTGLVTAVKEGSAKVTVTTDGGKSDYVYFDVSSADPTAVSLSQTKATLGVKQTLKLAAVLSPTNAVTDLTWESSNTKYATVDQNGLVTAKKKGKATITVTTSNGLSASAVITVKAAPSKVSLNKSGTVSLKLGKTLKLKASITKNTVTTLTWKSSKPSVATVDEKGVVTAVKKGTTTITVRTHNGKTAKVKVKVEAPKPTKVKLTAAKTTLAVKEKVTLKTTFTPENAESTLTWSTSNKKVATVSKKGVVTAKKKGTAKITVKTANGKKATIKITVK